MTGQFVDSPVEGLTFVTPSGTGVTNSNGEFKYKEGEEVFFFVGNTLIGQSFASTVITPIDMSAGAANADKSTNILRFLQTLDKNGDLSDGIQIPESVLALEKAQNNKIEFDVSAEEFEVQAEVTALINEAGKSSLVDEETALQHFEDTLSKLPNNSVDIKGDWIATTVYKWRGGTYCKSEASYAFTSTGWSIEGTESNVDTRDGTVKCNNESLSFSGGFDDEEFLSDPGMGCAGGTCSIGQLNRVIRNWEPEQSTWEHPDHGTINEKNYSVVELSHTLGSDTMRRVKTDINESTIAATGESSKQIWGVFETTFLRKEAHEYEKDMRGTWTVTSQRASCPDTTATHTITYSDTGITAVGEELNRRDGVCIIENMNESLAYDNPELPEEYCGPTCTWRELNGTYSDEGDTIKLSHKRGTDVINRTKGFDTREVWVKQ